ncbi:MAG TPA: hypothetical protein VLZ04_03515 [Gaiellaceae bacterium]|nr:hypothetical protein [Gaiellaceae bacterium]
MSVTLEDQALTDELDKLGKAGPSAEPDSKPEPAPRRRSRSGTSGAERARRARAGGAHSGADAQPKPARATRTKKPDIAGGMAQLYTMAGVGLSVVPSRPAAVAAVQGQTVTQAIGHSLVAEAGAIGKAWEKAAAEDPRIREALEKLLAVSTLGQIVAAHLPVVLAGMMAAGVVPAALMGAAPAAESGGAAA